MPGHPDLPRNIPALLLDKANIFHRLKRIDNDLDARNRILCMESEFRNKIGTHINSLPNTTSKLAKFNTNPFVIMFYTKQQSYSHVVQIEQDLVPNKAFSSMETSAGKMVEKVVLPIYGWEPVESAMHSHESLLDGRQIIQKDNKFIGVTLKSGPRTLNDSMANNIGTDLVKRAPLWAVNHGVKEVDFTYGVLYGTKKQSNKKDWHILRNIDETRPSTSKLHSSHKRAWSIAYSDGPLRVSATVRVGIEWWEYLGGVDTWIELCCALIRSCVTPTDIRPAPPTYRIADLPDILDLSGIGSGYNVAILQNSQLEWFLFLASHFSDGLKVKRP